VTQDFNPRVADRRRAARWMDALSHPFAGPDAAALAVPWRATVGELEAVVDGVADLTPELRSRALVALDQADNLAQSQYLWEAIGALLGDLGYTIEALPEDGRTAALRVSRADWHDEHTADVWIGAEDAIHAGLVREIDAGGDDAALRDADRAEALREHLAVVAHEMSHQGLGQRELRAHPPQRRAAAGSDSWSTSTAGLATAPARRHSGPSDTAMRSHA
jgi:hypothetical protein